MAVRTRSRLDSVAQESLVRAREHLLSLQAPDGWWKGELQTNVTMDAEDLLLRRFLGVLSGEDLAAAAEWIRSQQRDDGTWANFHAGPGDLSTTVEAYVALRLAGDPADAGHLRRAREWILDRGGLEGARVFTRMWMALFGLWPWERLPVLPPEMFLLPHRFPLNPYDFGCWARQTIVPLSIVSSFRPVRPLEFGIDELRTGAPDPARRPFSTWEGRFERLDTLLRRYERRPNRRLRELARQRGIEWVLRHQEDDGSWGGIQPPWVYSMIAMDLMGYGVDHPAMELAFKGLDGFTIREGGVRRLEACQSPVWDTALAMIALADAGLPGDDPALVRAADWIVGKEIRMAGDWAVRRPGLAPGGWAFEFANDNYPDIDDTAEVVLALRRVRHPEPRYLEEAVSRGVNWVLGMQSADGGWGAFDADNTQQLCRKIPFCDFGEVIDPPSADVTAHCLEMLAGEGLAGEARARRGLGWLARSQEPGGSWFGRWGANHVYGTGASVPAAVAAGVPPADPRIRAAVEWLRGAQNADGGWGEDLRSYTDESWVGRGRSTASQTAWALLALLAAGEREGEAARRGVRFLAESQKPDGTWDEDLYTGTGFPGYFYINYHLYRLVFPVQALGRFVGGPPAGTPSRPAAASPGGGA